LKWIKHPKGAHARVLLTSVWPLRRRDERFVAAPLIDGVVHNQVTRAQGPFSLRMFTRSGEIMMIQETSRALHGVDSPPAMSFSARSPRTSTTSWYLVHIVNVGKVREMCRCTAGLSPRSVIVVGGTWRPSRLQHMIDADHIVRGDGIP